MLGTVFASCANLTNPLYRYAGHPSPSSIDRIVVPALPKLLGWDSLGKREIPLSLPWRVLITIWGCGDTEVPQFKDLKIKEKYSKRIKSADGTEGILVLQYSEKHPRKIRHSD